ncbi:MAG: hypothetical protein ACTSPI_02310 [Candidatus Heimdallarchaeaceae archaeon]
MSKITGTYTERLNKCDSNEDFFTKVGIKFLVDRITALELAVKALEAASKSYADIKDENTELQTKVKEYAATILRVDNYCRVNGINMEQFFKENSNE